MPRNIQMRSVTLAGLFMITAPLCVAADTISNPTINGQVAAGYRVGNVTGQVAVFRIKCIRCRVVFLDLRDTCEGFVNGACD
jgi:hypothetical protein